jgi:BioD-like phosphotransacetylase family protein
MKSLYITSVERYSGKTATCLALGKRLKADGYNVSYLKPLSLQPYRVAGRSADEDAAFVKQVLQLDQQPWELSPIVLTSDFLRDHLKGEKELDLMDQVVKASQTAGVARDILLLEGGASLREGYVVNLPPPAVAEELRSQILVIVKYRDDVRLMDDALAAQAQLGEAMIGVIINRVAEDAAGFVSDLAVPYLEKHGIPVFGFLPEEPTLAAITVQELIELLDAKVLTQDTDTQALVETLTVGAMTADAALSRFRKQINKAVITGGDRTDIQLSALETSTTCLVLTGNLNPSPLIVKQAEEFGVTVMLVPTNTMETVESIERVFGKTRLGQPTKLQQFESLLNENVDMDRLYAALGLGG